MKVQTVAGLNPANTTNSAGGTGKDLNTTPEHTLVAVKPDDFKLHNEPERLKETVEKANKALEGSGRHFKYEIHEPTNQVIISVVDNNTDQVVQEIPAKRLLDLVGKLMELAGLIVDERR